jgi:geranylgeranyl reductase family protein
MPARPTYDVAIIGAGPAGATAALALRESGLQVALIDRAEFPRDKVCGDAIPARCEHVLRSMSPSYADELRAFPDKVTIASCRVVAPSRQYFDYSFHTRGYCSPRLDFDHFLLELALREAQPDYFFGMRVRGIEREGDHWTIRSDKMEWRARLIIGCDGANGVTAKQLAGFRMAPEHHCAAVRGYYRGIGGLAPDRMEIHFLEDWLPGYFWIFPLPDGRANVGFGMVSRQAGRRKLSLRDSLPAITAQAPELAQRFAGAELEGPVTGFGLPMGSRKVPISGEGFLLCGDAASLIEPATGEGIGNAMLSARLAAEVAVEDLSGRGLECPAAAGLRQGSLWKAVARPAQQVPGPADPGRTQVADELARLPRQCTRPGAVADEEGVLRGETGPCLRLQAGGSLRVCGAMKMAGAVDTRSFSIVRENRTCGMPPLSLGRPHDERSEKRCKKDRSPNCPTGTVAKGPTDQKIK